MVLFQGEEKDLWDKEKATDDERTESGSLNNLPGEETSGGVGGGNGSSNCSGSLQASDNSEDSHGHHQQGSTPPANKTSTNHHTLMLPTSENHKKGTTGESSTFLFIGPVGKNHIQTSDLHIPIINITIIPQCLTRTINMYVSLSEFIFVGKKRRYCRDRQKSGDMESAGDSPPSLPPNTPTGTGGNSCGTGPDSSGSGPDPSPEQITEELSLSGDANNSGGSGSSVIIRSIPANTTSSSSSVITSTPTPVIRSLPPTSQRRSRSGGDDQQPLNLSLPSPQQLSGEPGGSSFTLSSQRRGENRLRVSVISLASRRGERESTTTAQQPTDMEWDYFSQEYTNSISPGQASIYSGNSPVGSSGGEQTLTSTNQGSQSLTLTLSPTLPPRPPSIQLFDNVHSISSQSLAPLPQPSFGAAGQGHPNTFQGLLQAHGIVGPSSTITITRPGGGVGVGVGTSGSGGGGRSSNMRSNAIPGPSGTQKRKLQCKDCNKEFSQLRNYRYHRSRHEGSDQFACECPVCGKKFNDKGYLSSHLKIHRNAKEYKCEWCEKSFNQRVAYNMHVRIHTGHKPHKCPICPKAFSRKMLLRQHLRTHTGERPYKCEICGKAFADRSNMLLHQVMP